jgi:hypothetical protein
LFGRADNEKRGLAMALSWHGLTILCDLTSRGLNIRDTVTIGRQRLGGSSATVLQTLAKYGITPPSGIGAGPGSIEYAEPVFQCLGARRVESIDHSSFEGATLECDMNTPIPEEWHEQFDLVWDGGSIEHIFNIPQVLANYMNLVRVGGTVIVNTVANNMAGHGFYQFSPEFFYRVFSEDNGFHVDRLILHEAYPGSQMYEVPDPANLRSRLELSNSWISVLMSTQARRIRKTELFKTWPLQSDYSQFWSGRRSDPSLAVPLDHATQGARGMGALRKTLVEKLPGLRRWKRNVTQMILGRYPSLANRKSRELAMSARKQMGFATRPDWFRPIPLATNRQAADL